jgi:uncharacterized protein
MPVSLTSRYRALAFGGFAAAILIGAFALGMTAGSAAPSAAGQNSSGTQGQAVLTSAGPGRITVTGTGTVNGTPNQLSLSMGVQVNAASVGSALQQANQAVVRVTAALAASGVARTDIQTSGLSIQPNYNNNSSIPNSYGVSENLTATLRKISVAGAQIQAAVKAGGNAATIDGISLDLTDTSGLLARARAAAVSDARHKAAQYARAIGEPLGAVLSLTDQPPAQPDLDYEFGNASASSSKSVPISPGTQQLSVAVTVVYAIG